MITGIFYVQDNLSFPAVLIKVVDGSIVLVNAFTDQGSIITQATEGNAQVAGTFVRD